jgi:predicted transcriptional regulator
MHSYSAKDVGRVLQLSPRTVRGLIDGGFVTPARGRKREYRFSFQDMIESPSAAHPAIAR